MSEISDCFLRRPQPGQERKRRLTATLWRCPVCEGAGDGCLHCHGWGYVDDDGVDGWPEEERVPAPRPPSAMARPCHDCAYRPGSQEDESGDRIPGRDEPFWCHEGLPDTSGAYRPLIWYDGVPVGAKLCAGWLDSQVLGRDRPAPARTVPDQASLPETREKNLGYPQVATD